jgi:hypothetical protein
MIPPHFADTIVREIAGLFNPQLVPKISDNTWRSFGRILQKDAQEPD